jgi:uncharacterized repeat protein (TIGR04138 family)
MQELTFENTLALIVAKDPRYDRDAYLFVKDALDHTQKLVLKENREQIRHVTGQELLEGIREYALTQFGPMAQLVFAEWGVHRCEDFGEIVFNLVEIGLLGKTEEDSREDFRNGYDFYTAFRKPFLPSQNSPTPEIAPPAPKG